MVTDLRESQDLDDISIQDCSDALDYDKVCGLSDEQVSNIATDLLGAIDYSADKATRLKEIGQVS